MGWKQFVQNRANEIRKLVLPECWTHIRGQENQADVPYRGMIATELAIKKSK